MKDLSAETEKWNKVYRETEPEQLPWYGRRFPPGVEDFLSNLNRREALLVSGCGVGDVANELNARGFSQTLGTDISAAAIEKARKRFPSVAFEVLPTELVPKHLSRRSTNTFDWLNLHQIAHVERYLSALEAVSNNLCIVWIRDSDNDASGKSYVHDGRVYYHEQAKVRGILEQGGLQLMKEFAFSFESNPGAKAARNHNAIGQTYCRRPAS